jgi:sugar lactone lactonase YvrE/Leucine-rich repeat (LRR) protein
MNISRQSTIDCIQPMKKPFIHLYERKEMKTTQHAFVALCMVLCCSIGFSLSAHAQAPTVSSLSATSGRIGESVLLTGTNLGAVTEVRFFGAGGTSAVVLSSSATSLLVGIPPSASGAGQIFVANGSGSSLSPSYTITSAPATRPFYNSAATFVLGQNGFNSSAIATTVNGMNKPIAIRVDRATGKVFVADWLNHRVLRFASFSALSNGANAEVVFGQSNFTSNVASVSNLSAPEGMYLDSQGNLWIADGGNNRIVRFNQATTIANNTAVPISSGIIYGQPNASTNASTVAQNTIRIPIGVFVDESVGALWIADLFYNRVVRYDNIYTYTASAQQINASLVLGQADFVSPLINRNDDNANVQANGMRAPSDVWVDANGRLYVAELDNNRVIWFNNARSLTIADNGRNADGVLGQANLTSGLPNRVNSAQASADPAAANTLNRPNKIVVEPNGAVWVGDGLNHRVVRYDAPTSNGPNAAIILGQSASNTRVSGSASSAMNTPFGVDIDNVGRMYIADNENSRAVIFEPLPTTATVSASTVNFGTQNTGISTTQTLTITVQNVVAGERFTYSLTGTNAGDYSLGSNTGFTTAANATSFSTTVTITFTPTASGTRTGNFVLSTASAVGSPTTVSLTGTAVATSASVSASAVNFGTRNVSVSTTQTLTITVQNVVAGERFTYSLTGTNPGDYSLGTNTGFTTTANATSFSTTVTITFTPTASGTRTANFVLSTASAVGSPTTVSLTGTAVTTSASVSSSAVNFGTQSIGISTTQILTITVQNVVAGERFTYSLTGTNAGDYSLGANTGFTTTANATSFSTTVTITFTPTASGTRTANFVLSTASAVGSPTTVSLTGAGGATSATLSSNALAFGSVAVNQSSTQTLTITVQNVVAGERFTYSLSGANVGDYSLGGNTGFTTTANATSFSTTITITFTPTASGTRAGSLSVALSSLPNALTASLAGSGVSTILSSVTPTSAQRGETISIAGTSLGGATSVRFFGQNGVAATIISNSSTLLQVVVPNTVGSGSIFVQTPSGSAGSPTFSINTLPVVNTVSPSLVIAGQTATLNGINLDLVNSVTINNQATTILLQSQTQLNISIPVGVGNGSQTVALSGTGGSGSVAINVVGVPTVTAMTPTFAAVGASVTLSGTGLDRVTAVRLFGNSGAPATVLSSSATALTFVVPSGILSNQGQIFVENSAGNTLSGTFTILASPTVSAITPVVTTTGQTITITGNNLGNVTSVRFFGTSGTVGAIQQQSLTQVTVTVPSGISATSGAVAVANAVGSAISSDIVHIVAPPTVSAQSATNIIPGGLVTLTGTSLDRVVSVMFFGATGNLGTIVSQNATQLVVRAPALFLTRSGRIMVQNIAGSAESPQTTTVIALPSITSVGPQPTYPGQLLTLQGTNFTGVNSVRFFGVDGATANIVSVTDTRLDVIVPPTSMQTGQIAITNIAGTGFSSAITFLQPPVVSSVPVSASPGDVISISGTNLEPLRRVLFFGASGVPGTIVSSSASVIQVRVPQTGLTSASGQIAVENAVGIGLASTITTLSTPPIINRITVGGVVRTLFTEGDTVTITGSNFTQMRSVRIFGETGRSVPYFVPQPTSLWFVIPAGLYGQSGSFALTSDLGTTLSTTVTITRRPVLTVVQPTAFRSGDTVVIGGTDLNNVMVVRFFGVTGATARILRQTNTSVSVVVPDGRGQGRIVAESQFGISQLAADVAYRVEIPSAPINLRLTDIGSSSATLTFSPASTGGPVERFEILVDPIGSATPSVITVGSVVLPSYSVRLEGLASGGRSIAQVRAINMLGPSPYTGIDVTTASVSGLPNPPTNLRLVRASPGTTTSSPASARIGWNPPTQGGSPTGYRIEARYIPVTEIRNAINVVPRLPIPTELVASSILENSYGVFSYRPFNVTFPNRPTPDLQNVQVQYEFRVRSENATGVSSYTNWLRIPNAEAITSPLPPSNVVIWNLVANGFTLKADIPAMPNLLSVTVEVYSSDNNFESPVQVITTTTTWRRSESFRQTITGLRESAEYFYSIYCTTAFGDSRKVSSERFRILQTSTPGIPQLLASTNINSNGFTATWVMLSGLGGAPSYYELQIAGGDERIDTTRIFFSSINNGTRYNFVNLNPLVPYRWRVRAVISKPKPVPGEWSDIQRVNLVNFRQRDSLALMAVYRNGGGNTWRNRQGWLTTQPLENWYGVTVEDERVVRLELGNNGLTSLPSNIRQLTALRVLSVWGNQLTSLPDELVTMTSLRELDAHSNQITTFNLSYILQRPEWAPPLNTKFPNYDLVNLRVMRLNDNRLRNTSIGVIGGQSPLLQVLRLDNNNFAGQVAGALFNINDLRILNLGGNGFTSMSGNVAKWTNLSHFSVNRNALTAVPNLTNNSTLNDYNVSQNSLNASAVSVNASLNLPRVFYYADPQSAIVNQSMSGDDEYNTPNNMLVPLPIGLTTLSEQRIRVYPLPARDEVTIDLLDDSYAGCSLVLTDNMGRTLQEHVVPTFVQGNRSIKLNTSMLASGRYIVVVKAGGKAQTALRTSLVVIR